MKTSEKPQFANLLKDVLAFYRQDLSTFALGVWWNACRSFDFEQVASAMSAHAVDAERGQWAPKPADIVRQLQGTRTDRSLIAWGKALDAMARVGAYSSVCFDDGLIHATIEDMGGWPKLCRGTTDELPFTQRRFCETYRAYAGRPDVHYPARLMGAHDIENSKIGARSQDPVLIGNPVEARKIMESGCAGSKTQITHVGDALLIGKLESGGRA